ncbi:MAG TPA: trypsin-like peptidase domain-containing protein [Gemmatimonadaceae bacterium]|nr:trypsin-like peptidase domain-containing protein [Gemmatimonadaceae bacterium]
MRVEFRVTSGARAGHREAFDKSVIAIGRHPMNDFRFDLEKDADVSSRHAEVRVAGDRATLHDLGSTNGTYVNGQRVTGERALSDGDVLSFGADGPTVEFRAGASVGGPARRDTTARIAEAVERQTGKLRTMIAALGVLVVGGVGLAYWAGNRGSAEARKQIADLLARNDSITRAFDATVTQLRGKSRSVDSALAAAQRESEALRQRLQAAAAGGNRAEVAALSSDLEASNNRQRALMGAVRQDWESVGARNAPAMVFIVVQSEDGRNTSGTGFNVSPSGLIVTNRHVVRDENGRPAKLVVVKFENTPAAEKFKLARVVKVSETDELAWLKLDGGGPYPTVQGVQRTPDARVGSPVALMGYPLGVGTAGMGDVNTLKPVSTLTVGTASKVLNDTLQLDVYAAQGSSGSPVFDAQGLVIGVLFGSPTESNGRIIYAVPSSRLAAQMPPEAAAIVK